MTNRLEFTTKRYTEAELIVNDIGRLATAPLPVWVTKVFPEFCTHSECSRSDSQHVYVPYVCWHNGLNMVESANQREFIKTHTPTLSSERL